MSLSGDRMTTRSTVGVLGEAGRRRTQRVIRLELDHRPQHHPDGLERLLRERELREQLGRHACLGLVAREPLVAPGADDMVGGAPEVGHAVVPQQRQGALDDAHRGTHRRPIGRGVGRTSEVGPEQLVGRVQEVELDAGHASGVPRDDGP